MKKINHLLFIAAVALTAAPTITQAQGYDYQSIDFPGASDTQVLGVNDRGDAAGSAFIAPNNAPFTYDTKKGTFTTIAPVAGYDDTVTLGISDSGNTVGSVFNAAANIESGLILDKNGAATVFDHPDAFDFTQARGINNRGIVSGFHRLNGPVEFGAGFIYDPQTGTFTNVVQSLFTIAQGINSRGDVVGSAIFLPTDDPCGSGAPFTVRYGWVRTTDGNVTYFNVNGLRTSARGITDSGTVAGFATDPLTGETKGFVVDLDGTQCQDITIAESDFLVFPAADVTFVQSITNSGKVVGTYIDVNNFTHGFVATPQ